MPDPDSDADPPGTVCPNCAVGCRLARGASPSRADGRAGPANPEGRLCPKGIGAYEVVAADDRLTRPLVRDGDEQAPTDWPDALDAVVDEFEAILAADGPDALAFLGAPHCTNEENYLLGKLARTLGTNDVDNRARRCHVGTARTLSARLGWPATTCRLEDLAEADVVLVVGANPAERQPVAFDSFVRPAVNDGATLVHVDPVGNGTTRLADVHLAPRPGRDALVLDLLCAHVLAAGGVDRGFVDERTTGFEALAAGLADLDPAAGASTAGVDPEALGRVGELLADADRVAAAVGTGIEGGEGGANHGSGERTDAHRAAPDALVNLLLLTGNVGRPGTGLVLLRGLVNEQGATDAGCVPDRLPGHQPVTDPDARARVAAEWGVEPPAEPGATAGELLAAFGERVRGALVVGENPAVSKRQPDWLARKLDALDALVVVDVAPSETTPHADVVLPGAAGVEKAGTVTNLDRRVQRLRPTAEPPGEARPAFDVLRTLGRRLVGDGHFDHADPGEAFDELTRVAPTYAGVAYEDLDAGGRRWPFDEDGVLYRERFATPDGRAPFVPRSPLAAAPAAAGDSSADGDSSASGDQQGEGLRLVTGGRASDPDRGPGGDDRSLRIHPADAAERAVDPGERVVIADGATAVEATARTDESVRRGTVYLHAAVADPLLRGGATTVTVAPDSG